MLPQILRLERPAEGQVIYHGLETLAGDYELLALDRVVDGEPEQVKGEQREQLQAALAGAVGQAEYEAVVKALREAAEIIVFDQDDN